MANAIPMSKTELDPRSQLAIEKHVNAMLWRYIAILSFSVPIVSVVVTTWFQHLAETGALKLIESSEQDFNAKLTKLTEQLADARVKLAILESEAQSTASEIKQKSEQLKVRANDGQQIIDDSISKAMEFQAEAKRFEVALATLQKLGIDSTSVVAALSSDARLID